MTKKLEKALLTLCVLFLYCSMEGGLPLRSAAVGPVTVSVDNVVVTLLLVDAIAVGCLARPSNPAATGLIFLLILKIRTSK